MKVLSILALAIIMAGCSKEEHSDDYGARVVGNYVSTDATDLSTLKVEVIEKNTLTFTMITPDGAGDFDKRVFDQIKINSDFTFVQDSIPKAWCKPWPTEIFTISTVPEKAIFPTKSFTSKILF